MDAALLKRNIAEWIDTWWVKLCVIVYLWMLAEFLGIKL